MKTKTTTRKKNLKRTAPAWRKGRQSDVAASYASCSSKRNSTSIAQQQERCREKAAANGHSIPAHWQFADQTGRGANRRRAGLVAMLHAATTAKFNVLYLDSMARFTRVFANGCSMLIELIKVHKVRIISVNENFDSINDDWKQIPVLATLEFVKRARLWP